MRARWAAVALVIVALAAGCGGGSADPEETPPPNTPGYRLALLDGEADPSLATIRRYDSAIQTVASGCKGSDVEVARLAQESREALTNGKVFEDIIVILRDVAGYTADAAECKTAFTSYVVVQLKAENDPN
ncbi:hypothetical protein [Frankia sp. Cr2]|uniref:hypothetical protein n=1 Tax=Frankia sp. Cr2 TaxID=3073932 RepID=UPI002AD2998C|nr:hypothetical protein [Frankia sp. Cr2]